MGKGSQHDFVGLAMLVAAGLALAAACLGALGSLGAWAPGYEAWQLGSLVASVALAAALGSYHRRETARLRQGTASREREVARLRDEVSDLLRANEALGRNEARYRGALAGLPVAVFAVDGDGVFTLAEGKGLDALGLEPGAVVGRSIFDAYRDAPQVVENVRLALAGRTFDGTLEVSGSAFEMRYSPLRENGEFSGVLGVATDVTERREAEDKLRQAEARYRTLVEQIPAITYIEELSEKGKRLTYISPQYGATLGYSPEAGVSYPEHWLEMVHPDDREGLLAEDARTDETLEPFRAEYRMIAGDGRTVWMRDEAVVVRDAAGRPSFWQGVMFDVTEQKEAEERLREAELRYRTLVEQIPAGVYTQEVQHDGAIAYISPRIEDMLGYSPHEYVENPGLWVETTHPEDRKRVLAEDARTDETGGPFRAEFRKIARDGRVLWVRDEAVLVKDAAGEPLYWQGIFVDITERKEAEEALEESRRRLSALLSNAPAYLYRCRNEPGWPNEYVSDHALELTGYTPEELTDGTLLFDDLIVGGDRGNVWGEVQAALAERRRFELRYSIRRKDGEIRHVEERGRGVHDGDQGGGVIEGVVYDVTERVRAEGALREAEERYRLLVEQIPAVTYIDRADGTDKPLYTSPQIEGMLGYTPEEWIAGKLWYQRLHPEDRDRILAADERFEDGGEERFSEEYRLIAKDGSVVWVREAAVLVKDGQGEPLYWQGVFYDLTERKEAEEAVRRSEERLRGLADAAFEGLLIADGGVILEANSALTEMFEYALEELVGRSALEFVAPEHRDLARSKIAAGSEEPYEIVGVRKDGTRIDLEVRGRAYSYRGRRVRVTAVRDVTGRKAAEEALRTTEERYRNLVERLPAVTFVDRVEGSKAPVYVSPQVEEMFGYAPEEWMEGRLWRERLHPDDRDRMLASDERFEADGGPVDQEYRLLAKDGSAVWVREETVLVRGDGGEPLYVQGILTDITERKRAEEDLRQSAAGLAEAQRMAHLGNWEWNPGTGELYWSDETFRIYGFETRSFAPDFEKLLEVVHPDDRGMLGRALDEALHLGRPHDLEHRVVRPDGEVRVVHRQARVVCDESGEPAKMVGTIHDITERKALERQLQHQAMHDPLTGLPNRTLFTDRLRQALARAKRRGGEVAVLFMDLDNFKVVNDSLGHKAGDRLLVAASERVRSVLRPEDTLARLGGDEFVMLLEDADAREAIRVAERVLGRLRDPLSLSGRRLVITASVGVANGGAGGKYAADLLRDADLAMYRGKRSGKARVAVFEEAMNAEALERLEMEQDLRGAIERDELRVHYQPQMLLGSNLQAFLRASGSKALVSPGSSPREPRVAGVEALVRWEHPGRGLLFPGEFVRVAEETGLIVPIGEIVLEEACRQAKDWQARFAAHPPLAVCVNLSARQFREPDLAGTVSRVLRETGLDPACLHLEITETAAMSDAPATVHALERLKVLGVRLVIDDFGTGYSSLSYLQRFPVDHVKIDRSFVADLEENPGAVALVSGMIDLAHALGIKVIAEGVERATQLERLEAMGCDLAQGYHFSDALAGEAMHEWLSAVREDD